MKKMFDNKFLVFQVAEGPKIIIESLDTQGKDGWEAHKKGFEYKSSMTQIGG